MDKLREFRTEHEIWIEIHPGTFKVVHDDMWVCYYAIVLDSSEAELRARQLFSLRYAPDGSPVAVLRSE